MSDNQKFLTGLIVGAAAGTMLALYLQSEKGKAMLRDIKDAFEDAGENLKSRLEEFDEDLCSFLRKGKEFAEEVESKLRPA